MSGKRSCFQKHENSTIKLLFYGITSSYPTTQPSNYYLRNYVFIYVHIHLKPQIKTHQIIGKVDELLE